MAVALALILQKMIEKLKTNILGSLFEAFCRYFNNDLGLASVFNVKISSVCFERKWA